MIGEAVRMVPLGARGLAGYVWNDGERQWVCVAGQGQGSVRDWIGAWSSVDGDVAELLSALSQAVRSASGIRLAGPYLQDHPVVAGWVTWGPGIPEPITHLDRRTIMRRALGVDAGQPWTERLRVLASSWGIWAELTARAWRGQAASDAERVTGWLGLRVDPSVPGVGPGDVALLRRGLTRVLGAPVAGMPAEAVVIEVISVGYTETDFQDEAFAVLMGRWAAAELELPPPDIAFTFDRAVAPSGRYLVDWR